MESLLVLLVIRVLVGVVQVHRPMPLVNFLCSLEGLEDVEDVLDAVRLDSQKLELLLVSHTQLSDEIIHLLLLCQLKEDPVSVCSLSEAIQKLGLLSLFPYKSFKLSSDFFFIDFIDPFDKAVENSSQRTAWTSSDDLPIDHLPFLGR